MRKQVEASFKGLKLFNYNNVLCDDDDDEDKVVANK